jgi:hypothetical protein
VSVADELEAALDERPDLVVRRAGVPQRSCEGPQEVRRLRRSGLGVRQHSKRPGSRVRCFVELEGLGLCQREAAQDRGAASRLEVAREVPRDAEHPHGIGAREPLLGHVSRSQCRLDATLGARERRRAAVLRGELARRLEVGAAAECLDRMGCPAMEPRPAARVQLLVERFADERVREVVRLALGVRDAEEP